MFSILLAEDKESMAQMLMTALKSEGYEVAWAATGREAIAKFKESRFDLVISDLKLPYHTGLDILNGQGEPSDGSGDSDDRFWNR